MTNTTIKYRDVAHEIKPHTLGADNDQLEQEARSGVIRVVRELDLMQRQVTEPWATDGAYTLPHAGFSFDRIRGVWRDNTFPNSLIDDSYIVDRTLGIDESSFRILGVSEGAWDDPPMEVVVNYSISPTEESEEFPAILWRQHRWLIICAAMMNMGSYIRPSQNGSTPPWNAMFEMEKRKVRPRLSTMPGPATVDPFIGGQNDHYGNDVFGYGYGRY